MEIGVLWCFWTFYSWKALKDNALCMNLLTPVRTTCIPFLACSYNLLQGWYSYWHPGNLLCSPSQFSIIISLAALLYSWFEVLHTISHQFFFLFQLTLFLKKKLFIINLDSNNIGKPSSSYRQMCIPS